MAARPKASVCGSSIVGIAGSNSSRGMEVRLSLVSGVCCQVEISASGWSLVQRNLIKCGVSECVRKASILSRPWPTGGCYVTRNKESKVGLSVNTNCYVMQQLRSSNSDKLNIIGWMVIALKRRW